MINRRQALELLATKITDEIVVATYSSATDWIGILDRPLNYFSSGAMGLASSHGLGLALACPERRVLVLDGDGSLLMNLGTLVTIGRVAPPNLTHLVFRNGTYEANGGHPIPNPDVDFEMHAQAANIRRRFTVSDIGAFAAKIDDILHAAGPVFGCVMVEQGPLGPRSYKEMYRGERRAALKQALAE
ncbi:thiamine pyrophosphate-dependent enzyme [Roseiarcaceae bacterium H3SJ34-1]|uniref:thiamine pyrophosphate-dependent enzyme n=1 Tax=Terripilifer ovatus TaxID=3032367 RepID=UPI003AB972C1|nr:thiamine pyrophosphate-dependent enzyme [Roseiarcaceae bacterium H3SJ34-1]